MIRNRQTGRKGKSKIKKKHGKERNVKQFAYIQVELVQSRFLEGRVRNTGAANQDRAKYL